MRKKDLEKLILCLTEEEREKVETALKAHKKGKKLGLIFKAVIKAREIDAEQLAGSHQTSSRTIARMLTDLENVVIEIMGSSQDAPSLETGVNSALRLILRMDFDPALAIMKRVFEEAKATEQFNILFDLYELTEMMMRPVDLGHPTVDEVVELQYNLWTYEQLKVSMKGILKGETSVEETKKRLAQIIAHPLMAGEDQPISIRARATYLWLLLRYHFHHGEYGAGVGVQQKLVDLLNDHEWLRKDKDFFLIRENEALAGLYFKTEQENKGYQTIFQTGNLQSDHNLIEVNKLQQLYPLKTGLATKRGDEVAANLAISEFEMHCQRLKGQLSPYFIYRNQYFNAFFHFANGAFGKASFILSKFYSKSRSEIPPLFWEMAKVLEIFVSYKLGEVDEAIKLIRNIRMTSFYPESPFFAVVTGVIYRLCNNSTGDHCGILNKYLVKIQLLKHDSKATRLFHYFDLSAFIEAEIGQKNVLAVFRERTNELNNADIDPWENLMG